MGTRRKSREMAMEALFYMDMRQRFTAQALAHFRSSRQVAVKAIPFFLELVEGVTANRSRIDAVIERYSSNWKIGRMGGVDRNVMRVAVYEMLFCPDVPAKVSLIRSVLRNSWLTSAAVAISSRTVMAHRMVLLSRPALR